MTACDVGWCTNNPCDLDHFANPGGDAWPMVRATGGDADDRPTLAAAPTWGESDGYEPAVVLWINGGKRETDLSIDLTVEEAYRLGDQLLRAAGVIERMAATR